MHTTYDKITKVIHIYKLQEKEKINGTPRQDTQKGHN